MAAKKVYDAAVAVREYVDGDGNPRKEWKNVGAVLKFDDGGSCLVLDRTFNPAGLPDPDGRGSVRISFFTPKDQRQQHAAPPPPPRQQQAPQQPAFDDDIPF